MARLFLVLLALAAATPSAFARSRVDLTGRWRFAIDPQRSGEQNGWNAPQVAAAERWGSSVLVPHCWPVDARYPYNGPAWYRKVFPTPPDSRDHHVRLVFEAVFYHARVWLNGRLLGAHEGGYTPFEFDLSGRLTPGATNILVLEVDNSWSVNTIPGARPGKRPEDQVYPWWDYGGIVRDVYLAITPPVYVSAQRIAARPNLADGSARVNSTVWVRNTTKAAVAVRLSLQVRFGAGAAPLSGAPAETSLTIPPGSIASAELQYPLRRADVRLWDQDHPNLYRMRTRLRPVASEQEMDVEEARFGVRSIEARGQLLLNGEPVRMGGANRHSDHPRFGLIEPKDVVALDMKLMKAANMELSRISHYPAPVALLDWADENGVLIIEQCPIWGNAASQLASPGMQALFRSQLEEMIRRDWNHPSVIGWSVGNEYESASPQGVEWTREMSAFVRGLDPSRLTTLASMYAFQTGFARPEEEGSHHVDLINVNVYGAPERVDQSLDRIRARWPDRVILISEFGSLDALTLTDQERARYVREFLEQIRKRPYIAGASLWTFNDYRSRWPQASEDGYRHFGVVTRDRRTTPLYDLLREQFSPVVIRQVRPHEKAAQAAVRVAVRSDFPSYTIRDYAVRCTWLDSSRRPVGSASASLPLLKPSEEATATCACDDCGGGRAALRVEVMRPTGFAAAESTVDLR